MRYLWLAIGMVVCASGCNVDDEAFDSNNAANSRKTSNGDSIWPS